MLEMGIGMTWPEQTVEDAMCYGIAESKACTTISCRGWGNGEVEYYTTDNLAIANGQLQITARSESMNGFSYTSSRINTNGKVAFYPGVADPSGATYDAIRLEASIKAPTPGNSLIIHLL